MDSIEQNLPFKLTIPGVLVFIVAVALAAKAAKYIPVVKSL